LKFSDLPSGENQRCPKLRVGRFKICQSVWWAADGKSPSTFGAALLPYSEQQHVCEENKHGDRYHAAQIIGAALATGRRVVVRAS
jgi:hypothetical protein